MTLEIGQEAPDFTLKDQHGNAGHALRASRGEPVVMVFYPFTFSGMCTGELCEIRDNLGVFEPRRRPGARDLAATPMHTHARVGRAAGLHVPAAVRLLAARRGGARSTACSTRRSGSPTGPRFVLDTEGVLRWSVVNGPGEARPLAAYREALAALVSRRLPGVRAGEQGPVAQLVRAPRLHRGCRRFESGRAHSLDGSLLSGDHRRSPPSPEPGAAG